MFDRINSFTELHHRIKVLEETIHRISTETTEFLIPNGQSAEVCILRIIGIIDEALEQKDT